MSLDQLLKQAEHTADFVATGLMLDISRMVDQIMDVENISSKELAKRMKVSPAQVSKLLRGDSNPTLATLSKLALALKADIKIAVLPKHITECLTDVMQNPVVQNMIRARLTIDKDILVQAENMPKNIVKFERKDVTNGLAA